MQTKGMVKVFPYFSSEFYLYEQNHVSFPNEPIKEKIILEIVHSDVFGPVSVPH